MAVTAPKKLDARKLRADFPIFETRPHGKPLAYLDSANSSQKPRQMFEAMSTFYATSYANVHRSVYQLAELATEAFEGARDKAAAFVNAPSREIIFVRNATEALNLVAYSWGLANLGPGDVVLVTELEHHSNFVPWQAAALKTGADFRMLPLDDLGELRLDLLDETVGNGTLKVVATGLVSNALGTVNPVERLAAWAHEHGAILVCDAAQAAPHRAIDVQTLGADFVAVSGHKMCGPSGIGFLRGRAELLERMEPFLYGGHMIRKVTYGETTWADIPGKFEAGTSPIAEAVGLGAAIDYLSGIGLDAIEAHEHELVDYALERLVEVPGIQLYGPPSERRSGIVLFNLPPHHPHDVAQILDFEGVAIRGGHHCAQPLMDKLGVVATNRASFYLYTVREEIDQLFEALLTVRSKLRMSDFDQLYREVILDHYKNPRSYGLLEPADAHGHGQNPLCGDEVSVSVRFAADGETIEQIGFEGRGCAISQAATSMLTELVVGRTAADVAALPRQELLDELGVPLEQNPARLKCAILGLAVLKEALHRSKGTPLPDEWQGLDFD